MSIAPDQYATTGAPPAGWYSDPVSAGQRWWDGVRWTEHVTPTSAPASTGHVAPSPEPVATPAPVTTAASWIPQQFNPLDPGTGYEDRGVTPRSGPHRGPSGYVSPEAAGSLPPAAAMTAVRTAYRSMPAAFPDSYLPGLPTPKNSRAMVGFILGLVFVGVGVLSGYWFGSLLAVVVSIAGLTRARTLAAQGYPAVGQSLAVWGIVLATLSWAVAIVLRVVAF